MSKKKQAPLSPKAPPSQAKLESNMYDKIVKEGIVDTLETFLTEIVGFEYDRLEYLPLTKQQATKEVEPDFICIAFSHKYPNGAGVHLEFESGVDPELADNLLVKIAIERRSLKKPVLPFAIYLGAGEPALANEIEQEGLHFVFPVHYVSKQPLEACLASEKPSKVVMGILCDFQGKEPEEAVKRILERLAHLCSQTSPKQLQRCLNQLKIMSRLRKLQALTYQLIEKMIFNFDIEEDVAFIKGMEKGKAEGKAEGEAKGKAEGEAKGKAEAEAFRMELVTFAMLDDGFDTKKIAQIQKIPHDKVLLLCAWWELLQQIRGLYGKGVKRASDIAKHLKVETALVQKLLKHR